MAIAIGMDLELSEAKKQTILNNPLIKRRMTYASTTLKGFDVLSFNADRR